jgi:hypothetical protein
VNPTEAMTMKGKMNARTTTIINNGVSKEVNGFNYLGNTITATKYQI